MNRTSLQGRAGALVVAAACVVTALVGPAAVSTASPASRAAGQVVASAKLPPGSSQVEVDRGGHYAVVLTNRGRHKTLTKYRLGAHSMTRLGSISWAIKYDEAQTLRLVPGKPAAYVFDDSYLQTFDLSGRTPHRVVQIPDEKIAPGRCCTIDLKFAPDGRRAYSISSSAVGVLDLRRPTHPRLGTQVITQMPVSVGLVTSDGRRLVLGGEVGDPDPDHRDGEIAALAVYDLNPATGKPTLVRSSTIRVAGWSPDKYLFTNIPKLAASDDPDEINVGVTERAPDEITVARVRLSDLKVTAQLPRNGLFQQRLTANRTGSRLFFAEGVRRTHPPIKTVKQHVMWTGADLGARHAVVDVGPVVDFTVSRSGPTRGLVYIVATRKGQVRLSAVRVP